VTRTATLYFERSDQRVVAGVCGGIATRLAVDVTLVRLAFAILALCGGAGILLYLAFWVFAGGRHRWTAAILAVAGGASLLYALGFSTWAVCGATLIVAGIALGFARGGSLRPGGSVPIFAVVLVVAGACVFPISSNTASGWFFSSGSIAGAMVLILGPWLWRLTTERLERIRLQERADVAARIHDSVLQTLALVQRHADDPARVAALARRQERELRRWLYGSGLADASTLVDALADAANDVEELHGVTIELASAGDAPLDDAIGQLVLAAREAMTNAAKFSGVSEIAVYAETTADAITVFVRDRGAGFDRAAVPADRRGLAESIEGRMARAGGSTSIVTAPGAGTEVELRLPRSRP
jgi:signal transduction histidine kinase